MDDAREKAKLYACYANLGEILSAFGIAEKDWSHPAVPEMILERVRTYQSGFILRKSIQERESGAAFRTPSTTPPPIVSNPSLPDNNKT